ncbi:MAG TPA: VCBS repeat-containing protein [Thermoanaerobaculia bacterium]|nr:VCBS repeat-containing protein [Thermoanaerobaculia bacterium]
MWISLYPYLPAGRTRLAAGLLAVLALAACAQNMPPKQGASGEAPAAGTAGAPAKAAAKPAEPAAPKPAPPAPATPATPAAPPVIALARPVTPQPPDGKWLTDANGRQYFLEKLEKTEGTYRRMDDKMVRTRWGITIEVAKEDDRFFYYKVYKSDQTPTPRRTEPTAEELAAAAATYKVETLDSDSLRFVPFDKGLPKRGQWRNGFDIADMNGDGHLDIVHGPPRKEPSNPVIFLGDGKGTWRRWREARFPPVPFDYGNVAAADFNGDGHMDLVIGMHLRGLQVLLGDGKGNFTNASEGLDFQVPGRGEDVPGFSTQAVAVVDWNGDGRPDILALGEGPGLNVTAGRAQPLASQAFGVIVYLNQGNGKWLRKDQGTGRAQLFGDSLTVGDFNGDHRPDFATSSSVMGRKDLVDLGRADGGWDPVSLDLVRPAAYVNAVKAVDLDRDGRADLVLAYTSFEQHVWRSGIDVLYARPDGKWERRPLWVEAGKTGFFALGTGDLDGDGNLDLVALSGDGRTLIFHGDGKGFFTHEKTAVPAYPGECRGYHVQLADLDGDGKDEIVASFAGEPAGMLMPTEGCSSGGGLNVWHLAGEGRKP